MNSLSGRTLGKYDVVRELGCGTLGVVYLAHDPFIGRDVAIKIAHPASLPGEEQAARYRKLFFNEAKVAGMLRHPNIVSVYDAGIESEIWYIVMEYVAGSQTLQNFCYPGQLLPLGDVIRIIFKCAKALDFAHRKGIVHRDIKPQNIMVTASQEAKIGDFGVALMTHLDVTATQLEGLVGSPAYMSPELLMGDHVGSQSDIFSLGVIAYELLSGKQPFGGDNLAAIISNITEESHTPISEYNKNVPAVLSHILDRCLDKDLSSRYKTCMDLAADLSLVSDQLNLPKEAMSQEEMMLRVRPLTFFDSFSEDEIKEVVDAALWQEFEAGESIIQEGELDNSFYIITDGTVNVRKGKAELDTLTAGSCFGEMGFVAGAKRTATIVAKSPVSTMKVTASSIDRASTSCQLQFKNVFLDTMVRRLSQADDRLAGY